MAVRRVNDSRRLKEVEKRREKLKDRHWFDRATEIARSDLLEPGDSPLDREKEGKDLCQELAQRLPLAGVLPFGNASQ